MAKLALLYLHIIKNLRQKMQKIFKILRIVLIILLVSYGSFISYGLSYGLFKQSQYHNLGSVEGITELMVANPQATPTRELSILFIGNSYTFFNNMPAILVDIASSDSDNKTRFMVQAVTRSGRRLADHWEDGVALQLIQSRHWDYVVLQEQSCWAMIPDWSHVTFAMARKFDNEIKKVGARTLIFTTWAYKEGSQMYSKPEFSRLYNPTYMRQLFDQKTAELAARIGAVAIPVGGYWQSVLYKQPDFPLYIADGTHPSVAGSYLAALMFYRYFAGYNPTNIGYTPQGVTEEQGEFLRNIAKW